MADTGSFSFVQCGDVHLGAGRQVHPARYEDLFRVFEEVCDAACDADALLISGDLFDVKEPDVETLARTVALFHALKARAPALQIIAIEGNHDMRKRARGAYRNTQGVLDILRSAGLITLLRPAIEADGGVNFAEATTHIEGTDITVLGLGYSREESVARFRDAMNHVTDELADRRVIVLAHMMLMDSALDTYHGSAQATDLLPIPDQVLYVGLGHGHTRVDAESPHHHGVFYSPGSLEFVHARNTRKDPDSRGYFEGTVTADTVAVTHVPTTRKRPFLHVDVTFEPATATSFDAVREHVLSRFREEFADVLEDADAMAPILSVTLAGKIAFSASAFRSSVIQLDLAQTFDAIQVFVRRGELLNQAGQAVTLELQGSYEQALSDALEELLTEHAAALGIAEDDGVLLTELGEAISLGANAREPLERVEAHLAQKRPAAPSPTTLTVDLSGSTHEDWTGRVTQALEAADLPEGGTVQVTLTGAPPAGEDGLPCALDLQEAQACASRCEGVGHVSVHVSPEVYGADALANWGGSP